MSELQFPKDPIVGQEYDFPPYKYYWDGAKWKTKGIGYTPVNDLLNELEPRISDNESKVFEALKRSYADAGLTLVDGSFEEGSTLNSTTDVLLHNATATVYAWTGTFPKVVSAGTDPAAVAGFVMRSGAGLRAEIMPSVSETLRRSYADVGLTLVDGSFEEGGTLTGATDVLLCKASGKAYSGPAGAVSAGTDPTSAGFVDASVSLLRRQVLIKFTGSGSFSAVDNMVAGRINGVAGVIYHLAGNEYSTGNTSWVCVADGATTISGFRPTNDIDPRDFGAKGDGVADDTTAINVALSVAKGRALRLYTGVYIITGQLVVRTNTKIKGDGRNRSIIRLAPIFSTSLDAIRNETRNGDVNAYYDREISFTGVGFDGNNIVNRSAAFLSLSKVSNAVVRECGFSAHSYICIEVGANKDVKITNNYFEGNGRPKPSLVSSPCIWTDNSAQGSPFDIVVEDNYFLNNNWSCAYFMPTRGSFSRNKCFGNGESGVFSNSNGSNIKYIGNHIERQKRSNISASGIETGANNIIIADNHIIGCDSDGVSLTDVQNATVHDNIIFHNGQDVARFTTSAGIAVITTSSAPYQPDHINIHDNRIGDRQGVKTQVNGIVVGGSGAAVERVMITNNDLTEQKTNSIYIAAGKWGSNSFVYGNIGKDGGMQRPFKLVRFQTNAVTGNQQISGVGFRPRAIEIHAVTASGTQAYSSIGCYDGTTSEVNSISADTAGNAGSPTGSPAIIRLNDGSNSSITASNIVSLDQDGFTINNKVVTVRAWCIAKCYM